MREARVGASAGPPRRGTSRTTTLGGVDISLDDLATGAIAVALLVLYALALDRQAS